MMSNKCSFFVGKGGLKRELGEHLHMSSFYDRIRQNIRSAVVTYGTCKMILPKDEEDTNDWQ